MNVSNGGDGGGGSTSSGGSTGGVTSTTGSGGVGGTTGTTITGSGGSMCDGLGHIQCLGAYPSCAPVYDDKCCPTCTPGGCADCINIDFDHCAPRSSVCDGQKPTCGLVPEWACNGGKADCNILPDGSPEPCHTVAGCIATYCSLDSPPCAGPTCAAATGGTCTALCDSVPPPCPEGMTAEANGGCYTGMCIDANLCPTGLGGP